MTFSSLPATAKDPILSLTGTFLEDTREDKQNLTVGVYLDEDGKAPIFESVRAAEKKLLETQRSKAYIPQVGDGRFLTNLQDLAFGKTTCARLNSRLRSVATPGGVGALRLAAELAKQRGAKRVWVSRPTWVNHVPIFSHVGLSIKDYPYYDKSFGGLAYEQMLDQLGQVDAGDVVLLQASGHNPTGVDLDQDQWAALLRLLEGNGALPVFDIAYHGLAESLASDSFAIKLSAETFPEMLVAYSCSKNFSLYRERVGALFILGADPKSAELAQERAVAISRVAYTASPYHGCGIVGLLLDDPELRNMWVDELSEAQARLVAIRNRFSSAISNACGSYYGYINSNRGMFSLLGLDPTEVETLRDRFGVYVVGDSRINFAAVSNSQTDRISNAVAGSMTIPRFTGS